MTKANKRPNLSQEQQTAIEAIRARSREERPGPDELIDRGELDDLVPQAQYLEVRALGARMREIREGLALSLTDVSERSGLTRAVVSRLENGWNLNPTLETLFRYAEALGADLQMTIDAPAQPTPEPQQHRPRRRVTRPGDEDVSAPNDPAPDVTRSATKGRERTKK